MSEGNSYIVVQPLDRKANLIEKAFKEGVIGGIRLVEDAEIYRELEEEAQARSKRLRPWLWFWVLVGKLWIWRKKDFDFTAEFSKGGEVGECRVWVNIHHTKTGGERKYLGGHKLVVDFSLTDLRLRPENFIPEGTSVFIKEEEVSLDDFFAAVKQVILGSSLQTKDPRPYFLEWVKSLRMETRSGGEHYLVSSGRRNPPQNGGR